MKIDEMKTKKNTPRLGAPPPASVTMAQARSMALQSLVFLANDPARIERFLALTGVDPGDVRALSREIGFQLALLDHLASDEQLLLDFAAEEGLAAEQITAARRALGGGAFE